MPSLTSAGLTLERATAIRDRILDDLEALPGVGTIDRTRLDQRVDGQYASIMAQLIDELGQALQSVADARSINNAQGRQLDDLCELTGTVRDAATYSTAPVTLAGTSGTVIPAGSLVENSTTGSRWVLQDAVTLASGTGSGTVQAQTAGAVQAEAGQIDTIVSGVTGWDTVTNASAAVVGSERETDQALRLRRLVELQGAGAGSANAIRAAVSALESVTGVVVIANNSPTAGTVQGVALDGSTIAVFIWPDTLDTEEKTELVETIWAKAPAGIQLYGTQSATVTDAAGGTQTVAWEWATEITLTDLTITVGLASGYALGDVEEPIETLVLDYFDGLSVGDRVSVLDLSCQIRDEVPGVQSLTFAIDDGSGPVATDYVPDVFEIVTLDAGNLTVST